MHFCKALGIIKTNKIKKQILFLVSILLVSAIVVYAQKNRTLPSVQLKNLAGEQVDVKTLVGKGKPVVISFWATWCAPCKKELNNVTEIYEDWQNDYDVEVIAISMDNSQNMAKVKSYVNGVKWPYKVFIDANEDLKRSLNFQSIPYTILLDGKGNIVYTHNGYQEGDEYVLEDEIKKMDGSDIVQLAEQVLFLILKREWQKVWFRNKYR